MTSFALTTGPDGTFTVDGKDLTSVASRIIVDQDATAVPQVTVFTTLPGVVSGDGVITVVDPPTETDMREYLAQWLTGLDADILDARVKERLTSMRDSYAGRFLEVLAEAARG